MTRCEQPYVKRYGENDMSLPSAITPINVAPQAGDSREASHALPGRAAGGSPEKPPAGAAPSSTADIDQHGNLLGWRAAVAKACGNRDPGSPDGVDSVVAAYVRYHVERSAPVSAIGAWKEISAQEVMESEGLIQWLAPHVCGVAKETVDGTFVHDLPPVRVVDSRSQKHG